MQDSETSSAQKKFGNAVRAARKRIGISQENAADLAGLDRSYFGAVERGEHNISLVNIQKVCGAIGISASELFRISEKMDSENLP